uniref:Proprotein convertase subtilisin/kexin type 5a n=1 Tax=Cynoglossus semilaevis TaxID=244447 RepID=A0A3P8UMW7_CYNSE
MMHSLVLCLAALLHFGHATTYTSDWAIRIRGDMESVNRVAEKYGFTNMGQIGELRTYYMFHHQQTANRSTVYNKDLTTRVTKETEVEWLQQQVVKERAKRSYVTADMKTRGLPAAHTKPVHTQTLHFNDPVWSSLWYFHCIEKSKGCRSHMNIAAAWERGYTGKGVVVSVLDDGIEKEHPDLKPNYDPVASYDMNGRDPDPSPHYSSSADNYHGTRCAGIVAAAANNSQCTVGVSFNARIGGVRMLDGDVTDITEAQSLSFSPHYIDVYLSSWGPGDDGATLEGPGPLALRTLQNAVKNGRNGRGSIYVWASGNGGRNGDHCSCDGYSSSIYTIAISSTTWHGSHPDYLEQCPSIMATAFTGGDTEGLVRDLELCGQTKCRFLTYYM